MGADRQDPSLAVEGTRVLTVGHSIRPIDEFIRLLLEHRIERLVDVRTVPRSARNPQFNRETLPQALSAVGIEYAHARGLGGLRRPRPDSSNMGWRNASFRGYADYMETPDFDAAIGGLIEAARASRLVIMCAEAVPWRCHRSLIADALVARGVRVDHIMSANHLQPHKVTPFARVDGWKVTYPAEDSLF